MCENSAARTLEALERAAADALPLFKPDQCANFFAHAGYGLDYEESASTSVAISLVRRNHRYRHSPMVPI
jgi:hypothetical protein